ncbi:MAG: 4Fe-4S ferredoxin [Acidobacteria bacterium]|nr:4Fe-4S ferredoxin [Acidobacteriota bacterium]
MKETAGSCAPEIERPTLEADIACVGFGPAMGGFLTTLNRAWMANPADPMFESKVAAGLPLQVLCYERADDIAAGVSGVVTAAQGIRGSFPDLNLADISMAAPVTSERILYLLDPIGASRRPLTLRIADRVLRALNGTLGVRDHAYELPWSPRFLHKTGGLVMSIGQFNQWVGTQIMASGLVQIWPGMPVSQPLFAQNFERTGDQVVGIRLTDQGVEKNGEPGAAYVAGIDVRARLTVIGDGPFGSVGRAIDQRMGMPSGHDKREWALGMKFVIELPEETALKAGTVWHTFGYPEPAIFGFLYVHPERLASVGIFVPSWLGDPSRTVYRYLQHYIQHPALWRHLRDGKLRSWGAKSLDESGQHGEPFLVGDGYARIGEGSGSTNMLAGSGVDEAWTTGVQLAEAVLELLRNQRSFTQENLAAIYEARRRASWVEQNARNAINARNGFHLGFVPGIIGMAIAGMTGGTISLGANIPPAHKQIKKKQGKSKDDLTRAEVAKLVVDDGRPLHDAMMSARGWPEIVFDGKLLVSQQDALMLGGKVQAMPGFADHLVFRDAGLCIQCDEKTCIAMCSGQALTSGSGDIPVFEREKCVHCGACIWNCTQITGEGLTNIEFRAGVGGLHSAEN